jgi:hypothetical protein
VSISALATKFLTKYISRSVHNIRIERLWVDVAKGFVSKWADFFRDLEQHHGLNIELDSHIWLIHHLFLDLVNQDALEWAIAWNSHRMNLPHGQRSGRSPIDQFFFGISTHGIRGFNAIDDAYEEDPEHYGVDWEDMDDDQLTGHMRRRATYAREQAPQAFEDSNIPPPNAFVHPYSNPPRWSRVIVSSPRVCPLNPDELVLLKQHLSTVVDPSNQSMNARRQKWVRALQFSTELLDRRA